MTGLTHDGAPIIDPITVAERTEALLDRIIYQHGHGLAWGDLHLAVDALVSPDIDPVDLLDFEPSPRRRTASAVEADLRCVRRMMSFASATLRADTVPAWLGDAVADAVEESRREPSARSMRTCLLEAGLRHLRRARLILIRHIDSSTTVDIRLDAWSHVGGAGPSGLRQFLGGFLRQRDTSATVGRSRLGSLIEQRDIADDGIERLEARRGGTTARRRPNTAPILIMVAEHAKPDSDAPRLIS